MAPNSLGAAKKDSKQDTGSSKEASRSSLNPSTGKMLRASPRRRRKQPNSQHWESASDLSQEEKEPTLRQYGESASDLSQEKMEATKLPALGKCFGSLPGGEEKRFRPLPGGEGKCFRPLPGGEGTNLIPALGKHFRPLPGGEGKRFRPLPGGEGSNLTTARDWAQGLVFLVGQQGEDA